VRRAAPSLAGAGGTSINMHLDRFLEEFWDDIDRGCVQALADYQARHPEVAETIAREYALWANEQWTALSTAAGSGPTSSRCDAPPLPPIVGRYQIIERFATGGMSTLLRARDPELGRDVVLKTLKAQLTEDPRALARFHREARLAGQLEHPNVCPVLDVVHDGERTYVVLPLLKGQTLEEHLNRARERCEHPDALWRRLAGADLPTASADRTPTPTTSWRTETSSLPAVLLLLERVARGVHAAHQSGIVHRDLKPSNIMVQPDGTPIVLDFGLATRSGEGTAITVPGDRLGSPAYMAPEQVDSRLDDVGHRTDVHALGVVMYELLTLARPYGGDTVPALFDTIRRGEPVPPRKRNPALARDLEAVCLQAMAPEPARRYATAEAFAQDLANVRLLRPTEAKRLSSATRWLRRARRHPLTTGLAAVSVLLVLAVIGVLMTTETAARHRSQVWTAVRSLGDAYLEGKTPANDVKALLKSSLPENVYEAIAANPLDPRTIVDIAQSSAMRGDDDEDDIILLVPRGGITDARPLCRFRTVLTRETHRYIARFTHVDLPQKHEQIIEQAPDSGNELTFLPAHELVPGLWRWSVTLDPTKFPDRHPGEFEGHGNFEVVPPESIAALRQNLPVTGDGLLDRQLEAAALLTRGLGTLALERLAVDESAIQHPVDQGRHLLLCLRAHVDLGDSDHEAMIRQRWSELLTKHKLARETRKTDERSRPKDGLLDSR
jgi:serine/threonine protein kinase